MKKLCLLLALIMALASASTALAAEGDAILGRSEEDMRYYNYCFSIGDTLYLADADNIYISTYRVGSADVKQYEYSLPDLGDGSYEVITLPFAEGGNLYAINLISEYTDSVEFKGANLASLTLQDNGEATLANVCDVDWSDMVEYYDNMASPIRPEFIVGAAGQAFIRYYDGMGNFRTSAMRLSDGSMRQIDALDGAYSITPYEGDTLLVEMFDYEMGETAQLAVFDPADESLQPLAEIAVEDFSPVQGLAYDPATDTVYCAKGGEVCPVDLGAGEIGAGVTDMPLENYTPVPGCMVEGSYYAFCSEGAVIRNLDPNLKAQTRLKISDSTWNDSVSKAFYRFANAHGDVSTVLSHEYTESEKLVESMMNRDDDVDIYVLSTSVSAYDAVLNRGYLMELDASAKAVALAERMYPSVRENLSTNGHLVAVPVSVFSWTLGVNEKALGALGMKIEDVPDDWPAFLDFLKGLEGVLTEDSGVHLFGSYSDLDARFNLMSSILEDYQRYVSNTDPNMGYNTDQLRALLAKLEQIDFVALGCVPDAEQEDEDDDFMMFEEYDETSILLQTGSGCSIGNTYTDFTPILMRMAPDAPAFLVLDTTVAVVNPFTKNPEAALAFIDELVDSLTDATVYCVDPSLNEPIRGEVNQTSLQEAQEELKETIENYESATAEEKQSLEQDVRDREEMVKYIQDNLWDVSPTELEWYRAHDDNIVIGDYSWLYSEEAGEAMDLMDQYRDGQISANDMLAGIDKKVQMMLMEGN